MFTFVYFWGNFIQKQINQNNLECWSKFKCTQDVETGEHTVSTTIHGGNISFPHHYWVCNKILHCKAFQSLQFMNYCNKFSVFWLYVHTFPGTGWAMLHNNITKSDFLLAFFFICWKLDDVILLNKWRKRRKNSHFQNTE